MSTPFARARMPRTALPGAALVVAGALAACDRAAPARGDSTVGAGDTSAAVAAAHARTNDSAFRSLQTRGAGVMGVDQYTSAHVFESLPDGGRIVLERPDAADTAGVRTIREHMRTIAEAFRKGNFEAPGLVHGQVVPGTRVMAARAGHLSYAATDRPRGAEVRITTTDPAALAAVHEFLAFQRADHRAAGHEGMSAAEHAQHSGAGH
ncbi:MAG TPA: hypothetical protein VL328_17900 [Gemmatimonadaceae bacterium]|jgi:hypothetical protein|nr:hypothetical protein [Gemmatimonadaceae bacterium]